MAEKKCRDRVNRHLGGHCLARQLCPRKRTLPARISKRLDVTVPRPPRRRFRRLLAEAQSIRISGINSMDRIIPKNFKRLDDTESPQARKISKAEPLLAECYSTGKSEMRVAYRGSVSCRSSAFSDPRFGNTRLARPSSHQPFRYSPNDISLIFGSAASN
jgi:hypothetical protein